MTTIDPASARRRREENYAGSTDALVRTAVCGVAAVLGGTVGAIGVGGFIGQFRTMGMLGINETSTWFDNGVPLGWFIACAFLSFPVIGGSCAGYIRWNRRYSGRADRLVGIGPVSLVMIGGTVMLWIICQLLWAEPETVGITDGEDWGVGAWVCYWMTLWLPALTTAVTVLFIVAGIGGRQRADRERAFVEELLMAGRRVPGTVTEVSGEPDREASKTQLTWTFRFTDDTGQDRWVQRQGFYTRTRYPVVGGEVWVLFDPADPADVSRIFVSLEDSTDPDDFRDQGLLS